MVVALVTAAAAAAVALLVLVLVLVICLRRRRHLLLLIAVIYLVSVLLNQAEVGPFHSRKLHLVFKRSYEVDNKYPGPPSRVLCPAPECSNKELAGSLSMMIMARKGLEGVGKGVWPGSLGRCELLLLGQLPVG